MLSALVLDTLQNVVPLIGTLCQITTAVIAMLIGVMTFRYTRRQNTLSLINNNNAMANQVNALVIQSEDVRAVLARLSDPVVGCPDDAVILMYLNYVHNTFRMARIGAVSPQVWADTLNSCGATVARLTRDQLDRLLSRGYERGFHDAVLARHAAQAVPAAGVVRLVTDTPATNPPPARTGTELRLAA